MKIIALTRAVLSAALLALTACAGDDGLGGLFASDSLTDGAADRIIPADTPEERGLRACFMATGIAELVKYRLLYFESTQGERDAARAALERMLAAIQVVRVSTASTLGDTSGDTVGDTAAASMWINTRMFYVGVDLVRAIEGTVKDRVLGAVRAALTGQIGDILSRLRVRAGQTALANQMVDDVQDYFAAEVHDRDWLARGWELCDDRARENLAALE